MSIKSDIIEKIDSAKRKHLIWLYDAERVCDGRDDYNEFLQEFHTDCEFGKWLKENGKLLNNIDLDHIILENHMNVHYKFSEIVDCLSTPTKTNFFNRSRIKREKEELVKQKLHSLKALSKQLTESLDLIINKVKPLNEQEVVLFTSHAKFSFN